LSALRSGALVAVLALFAALAPRAVHADDLADFERARAAYDAQRYAEAVQKLELLVGGPTPRLTTRAIVLEARKYLGASYLFVARRADAERQFAALLADDPQYQIDPTSFPTEVREVFASVRTRLEREARLRAEAHERELAAERAAEAARLERERERLERLQELALTETFLVEHSRFIAALPFGIGQFQNGHSGLGMFFAVSEGALLATAITMKILFDTLPSDSGYSDINGIDGPAAQSLSDAYRITNVVALSVLAAVMVVGIVDAEIRFVPSVTRTRARVVPASLRDPTPTATLGVGPTGATFRLVF